MVTQSPWVFNHYQWGGTKRSTEANRNRKTKDQGHQLFRLLRECDRRPELYLLQLLSGSFEIIMCWFKPFKNPTNKKVSESKTHHLKHIRKPGQDIKSLIRKQQTHLIYHPKDIRTQHVRGLVRFSGCDYLPGCQRNSSTVTVYWFQKGTLNLLGSHRTILHNVKEREIEVLRVVEGKAKLTFSTP